MWALLFANSAFPMDAHNQEHRQSPTKGVLRKVEPHSSSCGSSSGRDYSNRKMSPSGGFRKSLAGGGTGLGHRPNDLFWRCHGSLFHVVAKTLYARAVGKPMRAKAWENHKSQQLR